MKIELFDSTLRDGAQGEGISFSLEDKLKILVKLDEFGIAYVEAGNPSSNPKDLEFFEKASKIQLQRSRLVAFGSTRRKNIEAKDDENVLALLKANTKTVTIFGKAWDLHVSEILSVTAEENLNMISDTIAFFVGKGKSVFFDAEHFFDGYKSNPEYAMNVVKTAVKAGAEAVILCDTNGGALPDDISRVTKAVKKEVRIKIGIHAHNDSGCAVANSVAAVNAGAVQVQGTFIGIGERCGNANLSTVAADLQLKLGYDIVSKNAMKQLTHTARYIAEIANIKLMGGMPYVGSAAFAHKGGMHADGVLKNHTSFEHITPETVGNERNFLLSEVSGRSAVLAKSIQYAPMLEKDSEETKDILEKLKRLEYEGFLFEAAAASFELLVLKELGRWKPFFDIAHYKIISSNEHGDNNATANAVVKVRVGDRFEITADEGNGPVNALDKALRKALEVFYPVLCRMRLVDYKVRVINTGASTAATTRVLIESTDGENSWTTVGASQDIINASMIALTDSLDYMLLKNAEFNYQSE